MANEHIVVLAGNPNSGKTTIFNNLTGSRQKVGNYPGVTVEKKEGRCVHEGHELIFVDLPGTYSLSALSLEEVIARNFLLNDKPDVVVDVIDSSNLERNLYLAVQLLEMNAPLVLAFNVYDVAESRGLKIDLEAFAKNFGAPVVATVGSKNKGIEPLLTAISTVAERKVKLEHAPITYGADIDAELVTLTGLLEKDSEFANATIPTKWYALKLLENDKEITALVTSDAIKSHVEEAKTRLEERLGETAEITIAERRYGFISGLCTEAVRSTVETRHTTSDKIDKIILNRVLGLPIFFALMYLVFQLTFTLGEAPMGWIEGLFEWLGDTLVRFWPKDSDSILRSLVIDGVIGGVGGVIVFLPNIVLLFTAITFLESTGYMARAAFILDRVMHKLGLNGKSFIPMLTGFGCSVPAIMATRTLSNTRDRLATMLVIPLMSCGARLPIYALIIPAFFPANMHANMLFTIYIIGIVLAVGLAKLLRVTMLKADTEPFVLELPPYRLPTIKSLLIHTFERSWLYLKKAGTVILGISLILWALMTFPKKTAYEQDYDAQSKAAKGSLMVAITEVESALNIKDALLTTAVELEFSLAEELSKYHDTETGYVKAQDTFKKRISDLEATESGDRMARFLELRDQIRKIRSEFDGFVEKTGLDKEREDMTADEISALNTAEANLNLKLDKLQKESPIVFPQVIAFLDTPLPAYESAMDELTKSQQSEDLTHTLAGRMGKFIEPVFRPLGFDWRIDTALIGAFAAKEVFVAQLGIVFSLGEVDEESSDLREQLRESYNPLQAFVIMLFCLISAPCMATIAVTKRESNSWSWAMTQLVGLTVLAYVICLITYQVGVALKIGIS